MAQGFILRWFGGSAGDTICTLLHKTEQNIYSNIKIDESLSDAGKVINGEYFDQRYPVLHKLGNEQYETIKKDELENNLKNLVSDQKKIVLKSHLFNKEFDLMIKKYIHTIDIGFDYNFLPFIIHSNIEKLPILKRKFLFDPTIKKVSHKLTDKQKKQIATWMVIKGAVGLMQDYDIANSKIKTEYLFADTKKIKDAVMQYDLDIKFDNSFFEAWKNTNTGHLPTKQYQTYLDHKDYRYDDNTMNDVERYILLSLSGKNFKFL
tara:strand:- start:5918 stop:6706 length:789 start_codon:yes stop_codon:yes gene_type:complete